MIQKYNAKEINYNANKIHYNSSEIHYNINEIHYNKTLDKIIEICTKRNINHQGIIKIKITIIKAKLIEIVSSDKFIIK